MTRTFARSKKRQGLAGFTLVELLVVMAIIAILLALTVVGINAAFTQANRTRAKSEIAALSSALEAYKNDNGTYPVINGNAIAGTLGLTGNVPPYPYVPSGADYKLSATYLYAYLSGNYAAGAPITPQTYSQLTTGAKTLGGRVYDNFSVRQLDPTGTFLRDPFNAQYAYGYYYDGTSSKVMNGANQFDLWSTGGQTTAAGVNQWISNWGLGN